MMVAGIIKLRFSRTNSRKSGAFSMASQFTSDAEDAWLACSFEAEPLPAATSDIEYLQCCMHQCRTIQSDEGVRACRVVSYRMCAGEQPKCSTVPPVKGLMALNKRI